MEEWAGVCLNGKVFKFQEVLKKTKINQSSILQLEDFLLFSHTALQYCFCDTCCQEHLSTRPPSCYYILRSLAPYRLLTLILYKLKIDRTGSVSPIKKRDYLLVIVLCNNNQAGY